MLNVLSNVHYYSQLPFEFLWPEDGARSIVRVFAAKDCLIMNRLTPAAITNKMLKSAGAKILSQAVRIQEVDREGNKRCKYFYGSKVQLSDLATNIGIMQVSNV